MSHEATFITVPSLLTKASIRTLNCYQLQPRHWTTPSSPATLVFKESIWSRTFDDVRVIGKKKRKCAVLWLRLGDLRLNDNSAAKFCSQFNGAVLPLLTLELREISDAVISAASQLSEAFRRLGSMLVIRCVEVSNAFGMVVEIANTVHAGLIVANGTSRDTGFHAGSYANSGLELKFCRDESLCDMFDHTASFPQIPHEAHNLVSNLVTNTANRSHGETAARLRLRSLLRTWNLSIDSKILLRSIMSILSVELRLGCISRARVIYELQRKKNSVTRGTRNANCNPWAKLFGRFRQTPAMTALSIAAYDVNGGDRRGVEWDEESKSFLLKEWEHTEKERHMNFNERWNEFWRRRRLFFIRSFFPDDVTPDYYSFTAWRFSQRCVSATIGVFGTSSLLFALGIRSGRIGQAAVISWVLKEGLGRVGKMIWAGSMGKDFDVDPKRWRFRSAMLYAMGNGLEIVTQIFPASFLVFATMANSMKQVSMLTSSATRNAMYRSFGERSQNIANITAKGEAQIVVADLIGMGCGIRLSKILGSSRQNILATYIGLTVLDLFGIYMELRQVVFRTLNAERSSILVKEYVRKGRLMTPSEVSPKERIFLKPRYKMKVRLSSIAKAATCPKELDMLLRIFRREFFLVGMPKTKGEGPCRLVLRKGASNQDVLRAFLVVGYVERQLRNRGKKEEIMLEEQEQILKSARKSAKKHFKHFFNAATQAGWSTETLLFNTMKRRGYWGRELESS